jgi:hypothetical protein
MSNGKKASRMAELMQFLIMIMLVFVAGIWFGANGLKAAQDKERQRRLEQEWQDWERRHG